MKNIINGFGFIAALLLSHGSAAITIDEAREDYAAGGTKQFMLELYLNGQQQGLQWVNIEFEDIGRDPLFCSPGKMAITGENVYRLTNDYIKEREDADSIEGSWPFTMYVMRALVDAFPCA